MIKSLSKQRGFLLNPFAFAPVTPPNVSSTNGQIDLIFTEPESSDPNLLFDQPQSTV